MGNRGTVIFVSGERRSPAIYLHWNGGPESVYAFLEELERRAVRADADYEAARFVQIVGEFFSHDSPVSPGAHGLSLGIVSAPLGDITAESLRTVMTDHGDNGFYVVDRMGPMVVRRFVLEHCGEAGQLRELPWDEVLLERAAAESHAYREGLREIFADLETFRASTLDA